MMEKKLSVIIRITIPAAGTGVDGVPISDELHDLLSGLLDPDPSTRLEWRQLEVHPYFTKRQDLVHSSFFRDSQQSDDVTDKNGKVFGDKWFGVQDGCFAIKF